MNSPKGRLKMPQDVSPGVANHSTWLDLRNNFQEIRGRNVLAPKSETRLSWEIGDT
jgi:hypothetical protein